jgi:hypothetical protein
VYGIGESEWAGAARAVHGDAGEGYYGRGVAWGAICGTGGERAKNGSMSTKTSPSEDIAALYRRAFEEFGASALWSSRPVADPTPEDALAITGSLRVEGDLRARKLAEEIERACRAAV